MALLPGRPGRVMSKLWLSRWKLVRIYALWINMGIQQLLWQDRKPQYHAFPIFPPEDMAALEPWMPLQSTVLRIEAIYSNQTIPSQPSLSECRQGYRNVPVHCRYIPIENFNIKKAPLYDPCYLLISRQVEEVIKYGGCRKPYLPKALIFFNKRDAVFLLHFLYWF